MAGRAGARWRMTCSSCWTREGLDVGAVSHQKGDVHAWSNTLRSQNVGLADVEAGPEVVEDTRRKPFGEDVRKLQARGYVEDTDLTKSDALTYEV